MKIKAYQEIEGAIKLESVEDIQEGDRLFYELGSYRAFSKLNGYSGWQGNGVFKEIKDVSSFVSGDERMKDKDYLGHHNFVIVRNKK